MNISAMPGTLIVSRDPTETEYLKPGVRLILPGSRHKLASTGLCLLHTQLYLDENFAGKRIIFDKFAGTAWKLEGSEFWTIPEAACLAVLDEKWCTTCGTPMRLMEGSNVIVCETPSCQTMETL